jgi:hypothetical protein
MKEAAEERTGAEVVAGGAGRVGWGAEGVLCLDAGGVVGSSTPGGQCQWSS